MGTVTAGNIPTESALYALLPSADFFDAYQAPLSDPALTPAEIFLKIARATPQWVEWLMAVRNAIVRQIGLKDVGAMRDSSGRTADEYRVGDRMGIFEVRALGGRELVLGIDDSHLDVRVSIFKNETRKTVSYTVSTVVSVKNSLGHIYMAPVGKIHPMVVRAMMRRIVI